MAWYIFAGMNQNNCKPLFTLLLVFASLSTTYSQEVKDTVYFDEDFSICERPVAEYYRVCVLNRTDNVFYKGEVEDYFIDGQVKMKGNYDEDGSKHGTFVFYNNKGDILKTGEYVSGAMSGNWLFYDNNKRLRAIFNCKGENDITPILLIKENGDTLLKNGNGRFKLNTYNDLPFLFNKFSNAEISGNIEDSLKTGMFTYTSVINEHVLTHTETYKEGVMQTGKQNLPLNFGASNFWPSLYDEDLDKIERFLHTNIIFKADSAGERKMIDFLVNGSFIEMPSSATNFEENLNSFARIFNTVLSNGLYNQQNIQTANWLDEKIVSLLSTSVNNLVNEIASIRVDKNGAENIRRIDCKISLSVDTSGYVSNSSFAGNLTKHEIDKINYYLLHISNLASYVNNGEKTEAALHLRIATNLESLNDGSFSVRYILYNADSLNDASLEDALNPESYPRPANKDALKSIADASSYSILKNRNAPSGVYMVAISFNVDERGKLSGFHVEKDDGYGAAEQVISWLERSPKWIPAKKHGVAINYRVKQFYTINYTRQVTPPSNYIRLAPPSSNVLQVH